MDKTESAEDGHGKVQTAQIDLFKKGNGKVWEGIRGTGTLLDEWRNYERSHYPHVHSLSKILTKYSVFVSAEIYHWYTNYT